VLQGERAGCDALADLRNRRRRGNVR